MLVDVAEGGAPIGGGHLPAPRLFRINPVHHGPALIVGEGVGWGVGVYHQRRVTADASPHDIDVRLWLGGSPVEVDAPPHAFASAVVAVGGQKRP